MSLIWKISTLLIDIFFKYVTSLVILAVIFVLILCGKYWKIRRMYDGFPSYAMDLDILRSVLWDREQLGNFPNCIIQKAITVCRKFENEGLCVLWSFSPNLLIFSDEYVKIISNEKAAVDKMWFYEKALKDTFGNGLVTSNGETWKKSRKLAITGLHTQMLKRSMVVLNENAELLVKKMAAIANEGPQDIHGMLRKCTLDIFCESILGVTIERSENDSKIENYLHILPKLFKLTMNYFIFPWLYKKRLLSLFSRGREHMKYLEEVQEFSRFVVKEMGKSVSSSTKSAQQVDETVVAECNMSLSQLLFDRYQKDPTFTLHDLQEEITTYMIAGHDTTTNAMLWCLFMLGHHQDVQNKVFEEVRPLPKDNLTYDDVSKLSYMACVIKESMRLYPTVPIYARRLRKEVQCGKYLIPKDTDIVIFAYLLHRNSHCYPDPEKFNPDRFSTSSEVRPWSYVPFSEGIRNCLGKRFAMVEMKVLLTHIIRNFKVISLTDPEDVNLCWDIMLTSERPLLFQLKPRQATDGCN